MIKNRIFVNIFSDYGWIYQTTFKTIRSDIKSSFFPKKGKIVPPLPRLCSSPLFDVISKTNNTLSQSSDHTLRLSESGQWAGPQRGGGSSAPFLSVYVSLGPLLSALVSFCQFVFVSICVSHFLFVSVCFILFLIVLVCFCPFLHVSVRFCQLM